MYPWRGESWRVGERSSRASRDDSLYDERIEASVPWYTLFCPPARISTIGTGACGAYTRSGLGIRVGGSATIRHGATPRESGGARRKSGGAPRGSKTSVTVRMESSAIREARSC